MQGEMGRQNVNESQETPDDSEGTNVQRMVERAKAHDRNEQAKEPSVLEGIRSELKSVETGPKVNEDLAEIVNDLFRKVYSMKNFKIN